MRIKIPISVFLRAYLKESSWTQRQSDYRMISTDVMSDFRENSSRKLHQASKCLIENR